MKKAVLLVLCMLLAAFPAMAQEETFATCEMPEGSESLFITEAPAFEQPDGLEGMYALMLDANGESDVYITRMRYGRALVSVSCTTGAGPGTAQELEKLWPQIARSIASDVVYLDEDPSCAKTDQAFGYEALVIDTEIAVGADDMILLDAACAAFYNGEDLIEVWAVCPTDGAYLYDDAAAEEWVSDREDMRFFMDHLSFPPNENAEDTQEA